MANPLARVIMTNLVDMDKGEGNGSASKRGSSYSVPSSDVNLSPKEESLLLDLIGGGTSKVSGGRSEVAKSYKRNSGSSVKGIQSLASLAGDSINASSSSSASASSSTSYGEKVSYGQKSNSYGQKSSYGSKSYDSGSGKSVAGVKALSLGELAGNGAESSSSSSSVVKPAARQQGTNNSGMVTLDKLAEEKGYDPDADSGNGSSKSSVKSTVIGNLQGIEGYVPKVSLGSIGKNSRF